MQLEWRHPRHREDILVPRALSVAHQPKDEHDFRTVLGQLNPVQRSWLTQALIVYRPTDPWLEDLAHRT
jgi:hypothetical protein